MKITVHPEILQQGDPVLTKTAHQVSVSDIQKKEIQDLIHKMQEVLASQADGVALAAPQVGASYRIFVVSPRAFADKENLSQEHLVYINPEIVQTSSKKEWLDEGCLSVRFLYGKTHRYTRATVTAYDEHGKPFTRGGSGLLAQIFQHEIDHLDGILFNDHAKDLHEYLVEGGE